MLRDAAATYASCHNLRHTDAVSVPRSPDPLTGPLAPYSSLIPHPPFPFRTAGETLCICTEYATHGALYDVLHNKKVRHAVAPLLGTPLLCLSLLLFYTLQLLLSRHSLPGCRSCICHSILGCCY